MDGDRGKDRNRNLETGADGDSDAGSTEPKWQHPLAGGHPGAYTLGIRTYNIYIYYIHIDIMGYEVQKLSHPQNSVLDED